MKISRDRQIQMISFMFRPRSFGPQGLIWKYDSILEIENLIEHSHSQIVSRRGPKFEIRICIYKILAFKTLLEIRLKPGKTLQKHFALVKLYLPTLVLVNIESLEH